MIIRRLDITRSFFLLLIIMVVVCSPGITNRAWSRIELNSPGEGITIGKLEIRPALILKGTYDDNIFWSDGHEQSDLIFTISPSLRLEYPGDDYLIRLAGRTDLQYFSKYTGENHCNYNLEGVFDYSFSKYVIKIKDVFRKTSARFDTEQRTRIPRIENTGRIGLLRDFQDLEIEIAYQNFYRHFLRSDYTQYDHQQHSGIGTIFYRVAPQVKILGEYTYDRILYRLSTERNGYYNEVRAGLKGSLTDKLTVTAKVGYQAREYDQAGLENYDGPVGFVAWKSIFHPISTCFWSGRGPFRSRPTASITSIF